MLKVLLLHQLMSLLSHVTVDSDGVTELMDSTILEQQWLNNSICSDQDGIFVVTSGINAMDDSYVGYLHYFGYDHENCSIVENWEQACTYL